MKNMLLIIIPLLMQSCSTFNVNPTDIQMCAVIGIEAPLHPECSHYFISLFDINDDNKNIDAFSMALYTDSTVQFKENVPVKGVYVVVYGYKNKSEIAPTHISTTILQYEVDLEAFEIDNYYHKVNAVKKI